MGDGLQSVSFGGGEPLSEPTVSAVLAALLPWARRIHVRAATSLARLQYGSVQVLPLMECFQSCTLSVAVDGPPSLHSYIRSGLDVATFLDNVDRLREAPRVTLDCTITVHVLNALALPETLEFVMTRIRPKGIRLVLADREHLDVRSLPPDLKSLASKKLLAFVRTLHVQKHPDVPVDLLLQAGGIVDQLQQFMQSADLWSAARWERLSTFHRLLDDIHKTSLRAVAPELMASLVRE
jgi:hypothetical protein